MNVWLVGMPGSGKTAVGEAVAAALGLRFVDADREVERRAGRDIPGIFAEAGEEGFRSLEAEVLADLAREDGLVVATGGGAVVRSANREVMRSSGTVVLLSAPLDALATRVGAGDGRPLLADPAALEVLADERADAYGRAAHIEVDASGTLDEVVGRVLDEVRP